MARCRCVRCGVLRRAGRERRLDVLVESEEIAGIVSETVGFSGDIVWDTSKPDGTPKKLMSIERIQKLGWQPKYDIRTGLKKYYQWYLEKSGLEATAME